MNCSLGMLIFVCRCSYCYSQAKLSVFKIACDNQRILRTSLLPQIKALQLKKTNIKKGKMDIENISFNHIEKC